MGRLKGVDVLRTVAMIAVIAIHTAPFQIQSSPIGSTLDLATVINQVARFAVPFFFVLSGYFWSQKFKDESEIYEPTVKAVKRIAFIFVAWSAIYLLPMNFFDAFTYGAFELIKQGYWNLVNAASRPLVTLMQGTKVHLWFLVGLLCSLFISALLLRHKLERVLVVVAVAFYSVGLAGKAYSDTPLGIRADFDFRDGPFFALIFFVTGYFLQRRRPSDAWFPIGLSIAIFGMFLHFAELLMLRSYWGTTMNQDYVMGTYFFGIGVALIALSNTKYLNFCRVASIGRVVLGIYASHFIFVEILRPLDNKFAGNGIWDVWYVFAVFVLSYALVSMFSRFHLTRRLVV